jgi:Tfp pilus assembly protein PilW
MTTLRQRLALLRMDDRGITLVETLVAMVLTGILGAIVLAGTIATQDSLRTSDNETNGQTDVAFATNQLSRDIRNSRGVVCDGAVGDPLCAAHLQLWVDSNSNYRKDAGETVTWRLVASSDGVHRDLIRETDSGTSRVAASTIVSQVAFTYDVAPGPNQPAPGQTTTRVVSTQMTYAASRNVTASNSRTVSFSTHLRNVP